MSISFWSAKVKNGVTGGVGMSFMQTYDGFVPYYSNGHSIFSYYLGVKGEYRFLNHFLVNPGMRFTSTGFGYKYNLLGSGMEVAGVYRINYVELPINLSFDLGKPGVFLPEGSTEVSDYLVVKLINWMEK